jgi:hypothetical protein
MIFLDTWRVRNIKCDGVGFKSMSNQWEELGDRIEAPAVFTPRPWYLQNRVLSETRILQVKTIQRHPQESVVVKETAMNNVKCNESSHKHYIWKSKWTTGIPRFTSLIRSSKTAHEAKTRKTKIDFREEAPGTTISLREEGARTSESWLVNWKTGINLCISYKRKLANRLLVYRGITVHIYNSFNDAVSSSANTPSNEINWKFRVH